MNYRDLYFEYKHLAQISVKPSFVTLHQLLLELKANAVSVSITLEGRGQGCIGIIMSYHTYATLAPMAPFIVMIHLGIFTVVTGSTQYETALVKILHN